MHLLCVKCWEESHIDPAQKTTGCPRCGDNAHVPIDVNDTVTITLPWQMFRIITIWAEQWATRNEEEDPGMSRILYEIADRIQMQAMNRTGLTLASEISDLRGAGFNVEIVKESKEGDEKTS